MSCDGPGGFLKESGATCYAQGGVLTVVFADLAVTGRISSHDFLTIFSVVIAFYFGTQSERLSGQLEKDTGQKSS